MDRHIESLAPTRAGAAHAIGVRTGTHRVRAPLARRLAALALTAAMLPACLDEPMRPQMDERTPPARPSFSLTVGTMTDLGTLPGGAESYALAISGNGEVVGTSRNESGEWRAFLWQQGVGMTDLGTLGGTLSYAYGINNNGQVVGWSTNASGRDRAFLWQQGVGMTDLGTLPGGNYSQANGINNNGQVVGYSQTASGQVRAFLSQDGTMTDLGTLGGAESNAFAINDNGQVVGWSTNESGRLRAFLLTTIQGSTFSGFFPPVQNLPALNVVKAGSAIPVKFSLGGNQGLDILAAGHPKSVQIDCTGGTEVGGSQLTGPAGKSGLSYDAAVDQYTYAWRTERSWANSCRQLVVKLSNGSEHRANFRFTR